MSDKLRILARIEPDGGTHEVVGRDAWALRNLLHAGKAGCTPIDHPGPRWSHYVFKLRRMGFIIQTIHEAMRARLLAHTPAMCSTPG